MVYASVCFKTASYAVTVNTSIIRLLMAQITNNIIVNDILIPSLKRLYQVDYDNIRFGVSERNICARLAHHMENIMR